MRGFLFSLIVISIYCLRKTAWSCGDGVFTIMEKFLTYTIKTGLLLVIFSVLLYFNSSMYPFFTLKTAVIQSIIEILTALWLALIIFYPQHRPRLTLVVISLLILLIVLFLSSLLGVNFYKSIFSTQARLTGVFLITHIVLFFFLLSSVNVSFWRWLWWASLGVASVSTIFGALGNFFAQNLFRSLAYSRDNSLFGNPSFLAGYLLFNVFVGLLLFASEEKKWVKIPAGILTAIIAFGILLTQTIGAMAGLMAGVLVALVYYVFQLPRSLKGLLPNSIFRPFAKFSTGETKKVHEDTPHIRSLFSFLPPAKRDENFAKSSKREFGSSPLKKNFLTGILLLILVFNGVFWMTKSSSFWRYFPGLSRVAQTDLSGVLRNRFIAWQAGWQAWQERPLLGYGWENFNVAFNKFYNPILLTAVATETYWDKTHSIFLEYLFNAGAIGLLAFLFLLGAVFYEAFRAKPLPIFIIAGLAAYIVQGLVVFDTLGVYLMLGMYLSYVDVNYRQKISN